MIAGFVSTRLSARPTGGDRQQAAQALPKPVPQPITRTAPGAQVAWIDITAQGGNSELIGIDAHGRQVARLDQGTAPAPVGLYGFWRSPDGASIFAAGANTISSHSALDGKPGQIYPRLPGNVVGNAISPDGRWMALLSFSGSLQLQVIDLEHGGSQTLPIAHDMGAQLPGMVGPSKKSMA